MASVVLLRAVSPRTRFALAVIAMLGFVARLAIVLAALEVSRAAAARATVFAIVSSAAWLAHRLVASNVRVSVECELYRATTRALLAADVLAVPSHDLQRTVFEGNQHARNYVVQAVPGLVADVAAFVVVLPIVLGVVPGRVLVLSLVALSLVVLSLAVVRLATRRLHERVLAASDRVYADVLRAVEGRLELVARGAEDEHAGQLDAHLVDYANVARRANLRAAALGRIPIALAALAVVGAAIADAAMRAALEATVITDALVLGASVPVVLGLVFGVSELTRLAAQVRPLVALLTTRPRPELARRGGDAPLLPSTADGKGVTFAYSDHRAHTLEDVEFSWSPDMPLVVVGPNGAGKSTLLRLLIGLRPPTRGAIRIAEADLTKADLVEMRHDVAYLPQRPYLGEPYTTIRESLRSARATTSDDEMTRALARVGLGDRGLDGVIGELSAGQRQRLALSRVIVQGAKLVVLDEPDANLDQGGIAFVRALVESFVAEKRMVALAAHTKELSEMKGVRVTLDPSRPTGGPGR